MPQPHTGALVPSGQQLWTFDPAGNLIVAGTVYTGGTPDPTKPGPEQPLTGGSPVTALPTGNFQVPGNLTVGGTIIGAIGLPASGDTSGATDTAAIAAQLAASGVAVLGAGTFWIDAPLVIPAGGLVAGQGLGKTIITLAAGFTGAGALTVTGAANVTITGLTITGPTGSYAGNPAAGGIRAAHSPRLTVRDVLGTFLNGYLVTVISDATADSYFPVLANVHALDCASGFLLQATNSADQNMGAYLVNCNAEQCQNGDGLRVQDVHDVLAANFQGSTVAGGSTVHIMGLSAAVYFTNVDIGALVGSSPTTTPTVSVGLSGGNSPKQVAFYGGIIESGTPGVSVSAGTEVSFHGVHFIQNGSEGFTGSGTATDVLIDGCLFDANGFTPGTNYDLAWSSSGNLLVTGCRFVTPSGSSQSQVTAAVDPTAGNTQILGNWFLGAPAFGTAFPTVARGNPGYNPVGPQISPGVPASGTSLTNPFSNDVTVFVQAGASTVTVAVNSTAVAVIPASGALSVWLPVAAIITLTYSSAPTWKWIGD